MAVKGIPEHPERELQITPQLKQPGIPEETKLPDQPQEADGSFANTVKEFISDVNDMQWEAKEKSEAFIKGEPIDLHDVMISSEKAASSFKLLLELRNKMTDLYREINRIQV